MAETPPFDLDPTRVIKEGRDGTVIYRGSLGRRPIAVKKMPLRNIALAENEIAVLEERDSHPNVVRYYGHRADENHVYLALELATGSLNEYVLCSRCKTALPPAEVCLQTTHGVAYLHSLNVVHRNLKPSNILFVTLKDGTMMVKISDYAITKTMEDTESFTSSNTVGSISYAAPELLAPGERRTAKVDIYSLGHVFYFLLTNGSRLVRGPPSNIGAITNGAQRLLIEAMTSRRPEDRPTAPDIIAHPAFWNPEKSVQFIQALSNNAPAGFDFERYRAEAFQGDWTTLLDTGVISRMFQRRTYNGDSLGDLIRMLRNLTHHRTEMSDLGLIIGSTDESLLEYLNMRLPNFMYYTWLTGKPLGEDVLRRYYE